MLGSIRKFSGSIYAKILLGIIIIPFVFWGMGSSFVGGSKNVVVVIEDEKYSIEQFGTYINRQVGRKVKASEVENLLSSFIGEKLIEKEIEYLGITLSDKSLSKLIKHQKDFKRNNEFSRTAYEKFLLENNLTAPTFESILLKQEKKKQLFDYIGGGIVPPKFLINASFNKLNQKRNIQLINLNNVFDKKLNFTENEINTYFKNNKSKYSKIYKSIKFIELKPENLVNDSEFTDLFFKKIDEIDDLVIEGKNFNSIIQKFNLEMPNLYTIDDAGKNIENKIIIKNSKNLINKIFEIDEFAPTILLEDKNNYFLIELVKSENIEMNIANESVKKKIKIDLGQTSKRKFIARLIDKINKNNFSKLDFDKLSQDEVVKIQKILLNGQNDNKILDKEIVQQIYNSSEKKVFIVSDLGFSENYLIYIDKIEKVAIKDNDKDYQKYLNLSKANIRSNLYNAYDNYIKKRYKIDINYQALDTVKNYFN
tara:strand:- start:2144 stop:3586 length:1443 start_codon:yes stop_codon:yes gene_type:complete